MYQTGTASGIIDLVTKLEAFCAGNGWTTDTFATESLGKRYHAHNGSVYLNMRAYNLETPSVSIASVFGETDVASLAFSIGSAYSGATSWFNQTGVPVGAGGEFMTAGINGITGAIASYHFFAHNSGTSITVVIEYVAGYYQYLTFGTLAKYGTYTGGQFMSGSCAGASNTIQVYNSTIPGIGFFSKPNNQQSPALINCTVDSETGWHWTQDYNVARDTTRRYIRDNMSRYLNSLPIQPNTLNGLAVLSPVVAGVDRGILHGGSDRVSPIGELPGVYLVKIQQLTPGQQITIGSTDYRVFPFWHKNGSTDTPSYTALHSATHGFAVVE